MALQPGWKQHEIQILRDNYRKLYAKDITKLLPNRSINAVRVKGQRLGLLSKRTTSNQEKKYILKNYATKPMKEMSEKLGKSKQVIYNFANRNGLKKEIKAKWKLTEEQRFKRSIAMKGIKKSPEHLAKIKQSRTLFKKGRIPHNFVDGKSKQRKRIYVNPTIKKEAIERYHNCVLCKKSKDLCVHHIDMNRENNMLDNLICLCYICHGLVHSMNRNQFWQEYFKGVVNGY